jgi:hypothetical protein
MKNFYKKFAILTIVILLIQTNIFTQTISKPMVNDFEDKVLNFKGQQAYQDLLTTKIFTFSRHGAVAADFRSTNSLINLLQEKQAEKALQSIIKNANPEGQIYALIGLQVIKSKNFNDYFEDFKNNLSDKQIENINSEDGGCDSSAIILKKNDVIKKLESGEYAQYVMTRFKENL